MLLCLGREERSDSGDVPCHVFTILIIGRCPYPVTSTKNPRCCVDIPTWAVTTTDIVSECEKTTINSAFARRFSGDTNTLMHSTVTTEMLQLHNRHRARHCAGPLTISPQLNQIAQSYAEQLAATSKFEHSGNRLGKEALGENLYMQWISRGRVNVSAKAAVKSWYDEIALHDFKRPVFSAETGHFTQMVWKDTKKMGVGVALSPDKREVYVVTNYYPAGNIVNPGMFERNVLPAKC